MRLAGRACCSGRVDAMVGLYWVCGLAEVQEHAASCRAGRYRGSVWEDAGPLVLLQVVRVVMGAGSIVNEGRRVRMQCVASVSRLYQGSLDNSNVNSRGEVRDKKDKPPDDIGYYLQRISVFHAMPNLNLSGSLNILRLFANPALCLPHHTVSSFDKIPVPLSEAFTASKTDNKKPDIRAVVLDKDNCFAIPHQNDIFPANKAKFEELRQAYPGSKLLIVSNSSGTGADPGFKDAELLEQNTGVTVLRHTTKKPGCSGEIMDYFRSRPDSQVTKPEQVAIVGDRLFTDMMMANMMGAHSVWVRDGVVEDRNIVSAKFNLLSALFKSSLAFFFLSLWQCRLNRDKASCR